MYGDVMIDFKGADLSFIKKENAQAFSFRVQPDLPNQAAGGILTDKAIRNLAICRLPSSKGSASIRPCYAIDAACVLALLG